MHSISLVWAATVLLSFVRGTPSISSLQSSVTLLFHNNLDYTDDANHVGALLLGGPFDYAGASRACAALGETLLPLAAWKNHAADITPELQYLIYKKAYNSKQAFWVNGTSISLSGNKKASTRDLLPVLCTQSEVATTSTSSVANANNTISVTSNTNTFLGYRNLKSFRFFGIPYADPTPRWTYSSVYSSKSQNIDATAFGSACYQLYSNGPFSEQCLYLNVFTPYLPASDKTKLKPVLLWIHGGGYGFGVGSDPTYDGGNMASRGDVVVVTINYRLGTLGFLALPGTQIPGNYGLADQVTALDWVRSNIAAFGGDKNKITIAGQSAGASSVRALLASPLAKGKFAAAIPGSNPGGLGLIDGYSDYGAAQEPAVAAANAIINSTSCNKTTTQATISCLESVSPEVFINLFDIAAFIIVDGKYVTSDKLQVTKPAQVAHVPTLWGTTAEESGATIGYPTASMNASTAIMSLNDISANLTDKIISSGLFPVPNTGNYTLDLFNVSARIATDLQFRCIDQATVYSGVKHKSFDTTWYFQFDRTYEPLEFEPNTPVCRAPVTASHPHGDPSLPYIRCHSGDLYYEFGTLGQFNLPYRDANDLVFLQLIVDYWTSFIRTHNPNPDPSYLAARGYNNTTKQISQSGYWSPVTKNKQTLKLLSIPSRQSDFLELKQCRLLGLPVDYFET